MTTLTEVTRGHSERLSALARVRDRRLRDAIAERDRQLRALPAAAKAYRAFDDEVAAIVSRERTAEVRAEASRDGALNGAHQARRDADVAAFEKRRIAEAAVERKFMLALSAGPTKPSIDAQRTRADELERARRDFDEALQASQQRFRETVDAALVDDRNDSAAAAVAAADQTLTKALESIPAAEPIIAAWRSSSAAIVDDYRRAEDEEFARLRDELTSRRSVPF